MFFPTGNHATLDSVRGISYATLRSQGCNLCPLNHQPGFKPINPRMPAHGAEQPIIYILGEAPGETEDQEGIPFIGAAGTYLKKHLPYRWESKLRWNNVVRTRPYKNATPTEVAIECCRPSIIADIEKSKPEAIFGFGNVPLTWATGETGIRKWNGRRMPIKVGNHVCWYFPLLHPSYVLHLDNEKTQKLHEQMSFVFAMDMRRAFQAVEDGLSDPIVHTREDAEANIEFPRSVSAFEDALNEFMSEDTVGFDLETVGVRPYGNNACILTAALSGENRTIAIPLYHRESWWSASDLVKVEDLLLEFLRAFEGQKVMFTSFEIEWMAHFYGHDLVYAGQWADPQAQAFILDGRQGTLDLNFVTRNLFGIGLKALTNTDKDNLDITNIETVLLYNAMDAKYHRLNFIEQDFTINQVGLQEVYDHHMRRSQAGVLQQLQGVPVSQQVNQGLKKKYTTQLTEIEGKINELGLAQKYKKRYGHAYRPSAPRDTIQIFSMIGHHLENAQEEEVAKINHPLAKLHIQWKETAKIWSTYIKPLCKDEEDNAIWPDGKIHPMLHLTRVRTWRSSGADPNPQNYPKHFGDAHEVRRQIVAPPGYKIVSVDYGQIQARNVAMESKDKKLVQSFWDRHDIHCDWRDRIFELYPKWPKEGLKQTLADEKLMKHYRNRAKNGFVFASFFGAGGKKVAGALGIPEDIGYRLAEEFDDAFPELTQWHEDLHTDYNENGYVTGLSGFRRYAPVAHTEVINTPIQSDEAIIVFDGMIRLCEMQDLDLVPIFMIHDDLTFLWPDKLVERYAETVVDTLLNCPFEWAQTVPLAVEMSIGQDWDHMSEIKSYGPLESDTWTGKLIKK